MDYLEHRVCGLDVFVQNAAQLVVLAVPLKRGLPALSAQTNQCCKETLISVLAIF